jgi:hypothetical protein
MYNLYARPALRPGIVLTRKMCPALRPGNLPKPQRFPEKLLSRKSRDRKTSGNRCDFETDCAIIFRSPTSVQIRRPENFQAMRRDNAAVRR